MVGGGDTVVMFNDTPAAQALGQVPGDARGGPDLGRDAAVSPRSNKDLDPSVYPDAIQQTTAGAIAEAETFRFDLSDLQPAEFGGTVGQGMFKLFQDFLKNPDNVDGIAQQMEAAAKKAYG